MYDINYCTGLEKVYGHVCWLKMWTEVLNNIYRRGKKHTDNQKYQILKSPACLKLFKTLMSYLLENGAADATEFCLQSWAFVTHASIVLQWSTLWSGCSDKRQVKAVFHKHVKYCLYAYP